MITKIKTKILVLGAGPAGYSSAFRCADLGLETIIVERHKALGGVCLNVGCIPSKALLHIAKIINDNQQMVSDGIILNNCKFDISKIRTWKEQIISRLTSSLAKMAKMRNVKIINGFGQFTGTNTMVVDGEGGQFLISFEKAIIASGSRSIKMKCISQDDNRIWNSTTALELKEIPKRMLVIGGGIIGLEMSTIYHALGSKIDIVETLDQIIPSVDQDIIKIFTRNIYNKFNLMLDTKVTALEIKEDGIYVSMIGRMAPIEIQRYDAILVSIGRIPNTNNLGLDKAGIKINDNGFICVDDQLRTNVPHIFAIGDVTGQPMLAHKGMHQGHIVAEVIAGIKHYFQPKVIPSISYTDPEIAWVGITEKEAKKNGINYKSSIFPWSASGRAVASNCSEGVTKLIFNKNTNRIIGGEVIGVNASEILGEINLAIEMGCDAEDIALTIHAHPTLQESIKLAAEIFEGTVTDILNLNK